MTAHGAQLLEQFVREHGHGEGMHLISATQPQLRALIEADEAALKVQCQIAIEAEICRNALRERQRAQQ